MILYLSIFLIYCNIYAVGYYSAANLAYVIIFSIASQTFIIKESDKLDFNACAIDYTTGR